MQSARSYNTRLGLSLIEVILALGLLAGVALVIIGVFLSLFQATTKNKDQGTAELLMESILERTTATGPPNWGVPSTGTRLPAPQPGDQTDFFYQVDTRLLSDGSTPGELWKVTVTVAWWSQEDRPLRESRVGYGNTQVSGTRSVFYGES